MTVQSTLYTYTRVHWLARLVRSEFTGARPVAATHSRLLGPLMTRTLQLHSDWYCMGPEGKRIKKGGCGACGCGRRGRDGDLDRSWQSGQVDTDDHGVVTTERAPTAERRNRSSDDDSFQFERCGTDLVFVEPSRSGHLWRERQIERRIVKIVS